MIYFDTETCGYHGPICLIQWAEDDGSIKLHSPWTEPIIETLELIQRICDNDICGFNLAFDWFHICQMYTTFSLFPDPYDYPEDHIDEIALLEPQAMDGPCLKPKSAIDLMLHARKGPYQSTMNRNDIRIKKIPTALAWQLAAELEQRIPFKDIYFANRADNTLEKWKVYDIEDEGVINPDFKDIGLKFKPSSALKALAIDALGIDDPLKMRDVG